jgi:hypothetical protein
MKNRILFGNEENLSDLQKRELKCIRLKLANRLNLSQRARVLELLSQCPIDFLAIHENGSIGNVYPTFVVSSPEGKITSKSSRVFSLPEVLLSPLYDSQSYGYRSFEDARIIFPKNLCNNPILKYYVGTWTYQFGLVIPRDKLIRIDSK